MSKELSPALQIIQDEFIEALSQGVQSAERMVNALAVQAAALTVFSETWQTWEREKVDFGPMLPDAWSMRWVYELPAFSEDIQQSHEQAAEHYSYAAWMLMNINNKEG